MFRYILHVTVCSTITSSIHRKDSFHHPSIISQEGFLQHDGIQIFQDATKHFEGHDAKHVIYHHQNLHCFKPTLRMSFRSDAVKLDDLMRCVEQVTGKFQSDIEKLAIFLYHFHADSRTGVAIRIQTMVLMKLRTNHFAKCIRWKRLPTIVLCLLLSLSSYVAATVLVPALTPAPTAGIFIKAKLAHSLSSLLANLLVLGLLLPHNQLALRRNPTTLQSAIVLRSDPTLVLSRLPTQLVSLAVKSRGSLPCREPGERTLTHGPLVQLPMRAAPLR
jgi:hypothetical protein